MHHAGRILIRTLDPERHARSWYTLAIERIFRRVMPNSGSTVNPQPLPWIIGVLESGGFRTDARPCWEGTPLANVLLIAKRT